MSNDYQYNGTISLTPTQSNTKGETAKRQMTYETFFFVENVALASLGYSLSIDTYTETKNWILLGAILVYLLGMSMKTIYYKFLHVWSDLIVSPCNGCDEEDACVEDNILANPPVQGGYEMALLN